ncbi:unnamed protein product, partial [Larinioides sclopetarius]
LFQLVSFILIGVAAYSRAASIITNLAIVGGIIACGVFLFLLSLMGLIGAIRHHQVLLFFVSFVISFLKKIFIAILMVFYVFIMFLNFMDFFKTLFLK